MREIINRFVHANIRKRLRSELEEDALLCLQDFRTRMLDFFDGCKGGVVILRRQIRLDEVVIHFVGILRVREVVEEVFEDRNRFAEAGETRFMNQQRIII